MKNPIVIIAIIVILALVGFGIYTLSQKSSSESMMEETNEQSMTQEENAPTDTMMKQGSDDSMMMEETSMSPTDTMEKTDQTMMEQTDN